MAENGRTMRGTFAPGHAGGPGRPRNAITNALRRMADPEEIAGFLIAVVKNPGLAMRDRLEAARMIYDRCEGKPVATLNMHAQVAASATLPAGWAEMSLPDRERWMAQLESNPQLLLGDGEGTP